MKKYRMKKIKTFRQLKAERELWQNRRHELEAKLSDDLQRLQQASRPAALIRETLNAVRKPVGQRTKTNVLIRNAAATALVSFLFRRIASKWRKN